MCTINETKICYSCKEEKHIADFHSKSWTHSSGRRYSGIDHRCKTCSNNQRNLRIKLNKGFENLKTDYCECCGVTDSQLMLDHSHECGGFRGFVCKSCNLNLGNLGDTYESIIKSDCSPIYKKYIKMAQNRLGKELRL